MFDKSCFAYWRDDCGAEMRIDYLTSSEDVLVCSRSATASRGSGCGFVRRFVKPGGVLPAAGRKQYDLASPWDRKIRVTERRDGVRLGPPA